MLTFPNMIYTITDIQRISVQNIEYRRIYSIHFITDCGLMKAEIKIELFPVHGRTIIINTMSLNINETFNEKLIALINTLDENHELP